MKFISLSKTVRTLGSIALLSVMVGTTAQPPAQAQEIAPDILTLAQDENGVCVLQNVFYEEFAGIPLSPEQMAAYQEIEARFSERLAPVVEDYQLITIPGGGLSIEYNPGIGDEKAFEISDASDEMFRRGLSTEEQVELLTEQYGNYATFSVAQGAIWTPERIAEGHQISRDREAQIMAILTPEQRPIYEANLALQERILACGERNMPLDKLLSPPPVVSDAPRAED